MSDTKTWLLVATIVAGIWGICASVAGENAQAAALSPGDILTMAKSLRGTDAAVKSARLALLRRIEADYLSNTAATQRVPPRQWREIVKALAADLPLEAHQAWVTALRAAFGPGTGAIESLAVEEAVGLVEALHLLGDQQTPALIGEFDRLWTSRNQAEPFPWQTCEAIRAAWLRLGEKSLAQKWAAREYGALVGTAAARSAIDRRGLAGLARALSSTGMTGKDKAYPEFAAALVRLAGEGKLTPTPSWEADRALASPLGTPETRQILEAELVGPEGKPRLPVAKILAWAHRQAEALGVWQALLDQKAAEAPAGDRKARWLQARAYAETASDSGIPPHPIRGKRWLQQALQTAQSPDLRLEVLRELVATYSDAEQHDEGLAYLATLAGQLPDEQIAALRDSIRKSKAAWGEKELATARWRAEYLEGEALQAAQKGDEWTAAFLLRRAAVSRERERQLLGMSE